jgi:hypothetical protein
VVFLASRVDQAPGRRAGDSFAVAEGVVDLAEVLGDGPGGLQVQQLVDAVALARAVALADYCPQVPVLDCEGDQAARPAGDMPGQGSPEPGSADVAVRVGRDGVFTAGPGRSLIDLADEVLDAAAHRGERQRPARPAAAVGREQQPGRAGEAFQDSDGGHDLRNRDPWCFTHYAGGQVVAVIVAGGLELPGTDEVPPCRFPA